MRQVADELCEKNLENILRDVERKPQIQKKNDHEYKLFFSVKET